MSNERRYVVLRHEGIADPHFDFMCERGTGALLTLRFGTWPPRDPNHFEQLCDHRREYLEYEGAVSNNRGFVVRVAEGRCTVESQSDCTVVQLDRGLEIRMAHKKGAAEDSRQSAAPGEGGSLHL